MYRTLSSRVAAGTVTRFGDKSLETLVRTDERYGHDGLFHGPRGKAYWDRLEHPRPVQNANLWPDMQSTYFLANLTLPAGSVLTLRGAYPRARYFKIALYKFMNNTFTSINESFAAQEIEPDPGSVNPYLVGANRQAERRDFTVRIVAEDAPADRLRRAPNTLYAGRAGGEVQAVLRIYLPDKGYDGGGWLPAGAPSGGRGLPAYEATLADGARLSPAEVVRRLARPAGGTKAAFTVEQWDTLVHAPDNDPALDPATAPARNPSHWEKFFNYAYSLTGAFKPPAVRAAISHKSAVKGGGDPTTQYLFTHLSRWFGPVYVLRGKMPTFPDTYAERDHAVMPDAQTQYWSLVSCEAAPSGLVVDGLADMQVPLDAGGNYTIVVSRPEDRPGNAAEGHGIAWLNCGTRGEGLADPRNRTDFVMLIMRVMANNPSWPNSPDRIVEPGSEEAVMGPYFPRGEYTDKATFEAHGPQ
jgi:hypothetical protein